MINSGKLCIHSFSLSLSALPPSLPPPLSLSLKLTYHKNSFLASQVDSLSSDTPQVDHLRWLGREIHLHNGKISNNLDESIEKHVVHVYS